MHYLSEDSNSNSSAYLRPSAATPRESAPTVATAPAAAAADCDRPSALAIGARADPTGPSIDSRPREYVGFARRAEEIGFDALLLD